MAHRGSIGGKHLVRIVTSSVQLRQLLVAHVGNNVQQFRIFTKKVLADVIARITLIVLIIAVDSLIHSLL